MSYSFEDDPRRYGMGSRESIFDRGISTVIVGTKDAYGTPLNHETITDMRRLQRRDNRSKTNESEMRNLVFAMAELDRMCSELYITSPVKENAASLYRKALKCDLIRGRSIDAFVAASIYASCRMLGVPRQLRLVADISKREQQEVAMIYRFMLKEMDIKLPLDTPHKYIPQIASKLDVSRATERKAIELIDLAERTPAVTGKGPLGVAGAAIYYAGLLNGERLVQRDVAKAAEITEVTLRNRYRALKKALK